MDEIITIRVKPETKKLLERVGAIEARTLSSQARYVLERWEQDAKKRRAK